MFPLNINTYMNATTVSGEILTHTARPHIPPCPNNTTTRPIDSPALRDDSEAYVAASSSIIHAIHEVWATIWPLRPVPRYSRVRTSSKKPHRPQCLTMHGTAATPLTFQRRSELTHCYVRMLPHRSTNRNQHWRTIDGIESIGGVLCFVLERIITM